MLFLRTSLDTTICLWPKELYGISDLCTVRHNGYQNYYLYHKIRVRYGEGAPPPQENKNVMNSSSFIIIINEYPEAGQEASISVRSRYHFHKYQ